MLYLWWFFFKERRFDMILINVLVEFMLLISFSISLYFYYDVGMMLVLYDGCWWYIGLLGRCR